MPATKQIDIQERLHVPTEREIGECKRLYMTCENALKTLREDKTQTRRIMDPQPSEHFIPDKYGMVHGRDENGALDPSIELGWSVFSPDGTEGYPLRETPGDTMLVTTPHWRTNDGGLNEHTGIWDKATRMYRGEGVGDVPDCKPVFERDDWHQIHASFLMPRWASRIAVEVQDVWVERIQDISLGDAVAEGCDGLTTLGETLPEGRRDFRVLWNDLHGEGAWERNDWVRCIEYDLITG